MLRSLSVCLFFTHLLYLATAQDCNNDWAGESNPDSKAKDSKDGNTDRYYMDCSTAYSFQCCGIIDKWNWEADYDGSVEMMIWRPTTSGQHELIHTFTNTRATNNNQEISTSEKVLIKPNDCIGWHTSGLDIVLYKAEGSGSIVYGMSIADTSVPVTWTTDITENRNYAIGVHAVASNAPTYATTTTSYTIADSTAAATAVGVVTFSDVDLYDTLTITMAANDYFTYTDNSDGTASFAVGSTNSLFDISKTTVTLTFTATDQCGKTVTGTVSISVTNDPPVITGLPTYVNMSEDNTDQAWLYTLGCTDDPAETLTYTLVSVDPSNSPDLEHFFIQEDTAPSTDLKVFVRGTPAGTFDYNTQPTYELTIQCSDSKDTDTEVLTISLLQNQAPVITNVDPPTSVNVSTNVTNADIIFTVQFTDQESDTVTFNYTCTPTPCPFSINDAGEIQATMDLLSITTPSYDMVISIKDAKNSGIDRILSIVMTDINSLPTILGLPYYLSMDENTVAATSIYTVSFNDPDTADTHSFSMTSAVSEGNSLFEINAATGEVTTKIDLDYEALTTTTFPFTVTLSDGRAEVSSTLTIEVLNVNEPFTWNSDTYRVNVDEGLAANTAVSNPGFAVTDPDVGDTLSCYMDCTTTYNGYYSMAVDCSITVSATYSLDIGLPSTITCTVTGVDGGSNSATTTLIITIDDVDNYPPVFDRTFYFYTVSGYSAANVAVGNPTATDSDAGAFGTFSYSLDQTGMPAEYFLADYTSGAITTKVDMQYVCNCSGSSFQFLIKATDTGGLVGSATVSVYVSMVTTTSTTTTTDRYMTFLEDKKNVAWLSIFLIAAAVTLCVTLYVVMRYMCTQPFCRRKHGFNLSQLRRPRRPIMEEYRPRGETSQYQKPPPPPPPPSKPPLQSVRTFPPPKELQPWRTRVY